MNVTMMKLFEDEDRHDADQGTGEGKKHRIMAYIPFGQDNAASMKSLANIFQKSTREIRQMVRNARLDGEIIVGNLRCFRAQKTQGMNTDIQVLIHRKDHSHDSFKRFMDGYSRRQRINA